MNRTKQQAERDAQIAEKVLEWRWFKVVNIAVLVPPFMAEDWLQHPALYTPIPSPGTLQREHIDGVWFLSDKTRTPEFDDFTTEVGAAMRAIKYVMEGRTHWTMCFKYNGHGVSCQITIPSYEYDGFADTEAEAMCQAILKLVEDKR